MVTTTIFCMFKKIKGRLSLLSRDMENIFLNTQIKCLEMETTMSETKK